MDWTQIPIVQGGAVAILFGVMWMIFSGRLMPRSTFDTIREDQNARIAQQQEEITQWRAAWETSNETKAELVSQLGDLLEIGKATEQVLRSISQRAEP